MCFDPASVWVACVSRAEELCPQEPLVQAPAASASLGHSRRAQVCSRLRVKSAKDWQMTSIGGWVKVVIVRWVYCAIFGRMLHEVKLKAGGGEGGSVVRSCQQLF